MCVGGGGLNHTTAVHAGCTANHIFQGPYSRVQNTASVPHKVALSVSASSFLMLVWHGLLVCLWEDLFGFFDEKLLAHDLNNLLLETPTRLIHEPCPNINSSVN